MGNSMQGALIPIVVFLVAYIALSLGLVNKAVAAVYKIEKRFYNLI